ncbi:hypothetical protein NDU88_001855 [Pleurodeles waltl]|uniref:Uncharacterized protein n=1 Tax=Pleurodeles waltl TaxID=8319 RepID=A0AAV7P8B5_PLEWA|nr:hypothetical protein NDU88_001855 [Pleurodeles waltl]
MPDFRWLEGEEGETVNNDRLLKENGGSGNSVDVNKEIGGKENSAEMNEDVECRGRFEKVDGGVSEVLDGERVRKPPGWLKDFVCGEKVFLS